MRKVDINELVNMQQAATLCNMSERRLRQIAENGMGPPSYKVMGEKTAYLRTETLKWNERRKKNKSKTRIPKPHAGGEVSQQT